MRESAAFEFACVLRVLKLARKFNDDLPLAILLSKGARGFLCERDGAESAMGSEWFECPWRLIFKDSEEGC